MQRECCHLLMFVFLVFKAPAFSMQQPQPQHSLVFKADKSVLQVNLPGWVQLCQCISIIQYTPRLLIVRHKSSDLCNKMFMIREKAYYPASRMYKYLMDHEFEFQECNKTYATTTKFNHHLCQGTVSFMMKDEMFSYHL